jgi:arginyl-tRNA synthetase
LISPACFLQTQIADALRRMYENGALEISALKHVLNPADITVRSGSHKQQSIDGSHYSCAIAFSLSHQLGRSPLVVAQMLAKPIRELVSDRFQVEVVGDGWLNFDLLDSFMAESLSNLCQILGRQSLSLPGAVNRANITSPGATTNFSGYSYVQYAYARCCALLRLAQQQELVGDLQSFNWQLLHPKGSLYLHAPTERRLALCLLAIADEILPELDRQISVKLSKKLSKNLASNFLDFYASCEVFSSDREVAIARIGLVATVEKAIAHLVADQILLPKSL